MTHTPEDIDKLVEGLRKPANSDENMQRWDYIRRLVASNRGGSYPRDIFESILSACDEEREQAADALTAQQKRIAELEGTLTEIYEYPSGQPITLGLSEEDWQRRRAEQMRFIARTALQADTGKGE
ncbi:hypothetical protein [Ruegeria lacuscaerulensis]|uniref:hypothetical protein n=1 Tax=Ruegeria lacuscaerulensis TaxID=55218 RepID=UPI0014815153|nr:hypothetical protein [Ruegeria lacuscaerulensis]